MFVEIQSQERSTVCVEIYSQERSRVCVETPFGRPFPKIPNGFTLVAEAFKSALCDILPGDAFQSLASSSSTDMPVAVLLSWSEQRYIVCSH